METYAWFIHATNIYGASIMSQALVLEIGQRVLRNQRAKKGFCSQKLHLVGEIDNQKITRAERKVWEGVPVL